MGRIEKVFGTHDENTMEQLRDVATRAERVALMADGHLGYIMPVGGVAAYDNRVPIAGVGFDIACGNAAIRTDLTLGDVQDDLDALADQIFAEIDFGVGGANQHELAPTDDPVFEHSAWEAIPHQYRKGLREKARAQLGTTGGGNHYVDVFADEHGRVWVGVHFGSRGLGHTIASNFLALTKGEPWGARVKEHEGLVHLQNPIGHDYWHLMEMAGAYAYAGREWVARTVVAILGGVEVEMVHNHHNYAWLETHFDQPVIVVRKGATPAFPGQKGFVGGSMGDNAVILQGVTETPDDNGRTEWLQKQAMFSTVHGAGRVMSRSQAKREVAKEEMDAWIKERGVIVRGGDLDESPQAYRRLPDVLEAQGSTVEVLHQLRPLIVCMAP